MYGMKNAVAVTVDTKYNTEAAAQIHFVILYFAVCKIMSATEDIGISAKDEAFDLLARAKEVFESPDVDKKTKEQLYREFMKLYLSMQEK